MGTKERHIHCPGDDHPSEAEAAAPLLMCVINLHQLRGTCVASHSGELNRKRW